MKEYGGREPVLRPPEDVDACGVQVTRAKAQDLGFLGTVRGR